MRLAIVLWQMTKFSLALRDEQNLFALQERQKHKNVAYRKAGRLNDAFLRLSLLCYQFQHKEFPRNAVSNLSGPSDNQNSGSRMLTTTVPGFPWKAVAI